MKINETCPKCGGLAWYERELDPEGGWEVHLLCCCGYRAALYSETRGTMRVPKRIMQPKPLPPGSQLSKCLGYVASVYPDSMQTPDVAKALEVTPARAAHYLTVLRIKGLLVRTQVRKGKEGGSYWKLTSNACKMLHIDVGGDNASDHSLPGW